MTDVLVLCYHAVSPDWPAVLSVTPDELTRQLRHLVDRGYRGAAISDAIEDPPHPRTVAVTFDDSYRSVFELAHPILGDLGLPGTVFVPTGFASSERPMSWPGITQWLDGPHEHELLPMSWDELGQLAVDGWEIGSHTRTHPRLPELDPASLKEELSGSRADVETHLGTPCRSLAYPYGEWDDGAVEGARAAGYATACTLGDLALSPAPLAWPRAGIYHTDRALRFRLKVSPLVRRLRATADQLTPRQAAGNGS